MKALTLIDIGLMPYLDALNLQLHTLREVQEGKDDTLILLEHPRVITLGLNAKEQNLLFSEQDLLAQGFDIQRVKRGGDVTYHGPGQLVGYTIMNLKKNHRSSIKAFVYGLEETIIQMLASHYGIQAHRDPINAGVFVGKNKLCAIGLSVHKGVTMHGFALNVHPNLEDFKSIVPCGLSDRGVTSILSLTGQSQNMDEVKSKLVDAFKSQFSYM